MEEQRPTARLPESSPETSKVGPAAFEAEPARRQAGRQAEDLHICPACDSELVHPTDWAPAADRRWLVERRCPDCEWTGSGTYGQSVVDRFDEVLDDGTEAVLADLSTLSRANMEEHVEMFVAALWGNQILPEDF